MRRLRRALCLLLLSPVAAGMATMSAPALALDPASVLAPVATTVHPRLLFSAADVPGMRARIALGGVPQQAWNRLQEKAEGHLIRVSPDVVRANVYLPVKELVRTPLNPNGTDLQGFQQPYTLQGEMTSYLIELGLAYQLSGDTVNERDERFGRHTIELLRSLGSAGWPFWTGGDDLGLGDLGLGAGLAFDWTYERMTPAERAEIVGSMTAVQDTLFVRSMFEYTNEASEYRTSNWSGVMGGGTGMLLLAIRGEPAAPTVFDSPLGPQIPNRPAGTLWPARRYTYQDYLDKALVKAGRYFEYGFDALGAGHEGHTYANYGLDRSIPFAKAAKREGLADFIATSGVRNTARWRAFEQLPGEGQNFVNINDSTRTAGTVGFESLMFAVAPDNGIAQWNWRRTVGDLGVDYYNDAYFPAPVADEACPLDRWGEAPLVSAACPALLHTAANAWAVLYYRTPAETREIDPATAGPLSVHYDAMGLVDARTGFDGRGPGERGEHEVVSTFQARRNARTGHFQYDGGNFTLYGEGGRWAIDPGSACVGCGATYAKGMDEGHPIFHNTIVIDGSKFTQSEFSRYYDGVTVDNFVNGPNVSLTHADMRYAYSYDPNAQFDSPFAGRDHLFSRVPGRPVVLGIADELERDAIPFPRRYQWQMITDRANTVAVSGSGFTIQAPSGARLVGRTARDVNPTTTALPAADPTVKAETIFFNNNTDDSGPQFKISTETVPQQKLEQVTVMAITPAGADPATMTTLRLNGANAVAVDWEGTREVFLRQVRNATAVSGEVQTDARVAKFIVGQGETVMRDGRSLSAYGRNYVTVTGGRSRVVVSGNEVQAKGAAANRYLVFAPQTINSVSVNGAQVSSCRSGDYLSFPGRCSTSIVITSPASAPATDQLSASAVLTSGGLPLSGRAVTFTVGALSQNAVTDAVGVARVSIPLQLDAGGYSLTASYAGDAVYAPSAAVNPLTVVRDVTVLTYTGATTARGEQVEVAATFQDDDPTALAGQQVVFSAGASVVTATTDAFGVARAVLLIPDHGRSQTVTASYAGSPRYASATTTNTVTWGSG